MKVKDFFSIFDSTSDGYVVTVYNYRRKNTHGSDFKVKLNRKNFMYNLLAELAECEYEITSITFDNNNLVIVIDFPEDTTLEDWRAKCLV